MTEPTVAESKKPAPAKKPEENALQRRARNRREKIGHVVRALEAIKPPFGLRTNGASLFASHMEVELGLEALSKLTAAQVDEHAASFRARYPQAWGAVASCNVVQFVRMLKASGLRDKDDDSTQLIGEYQGAMSELAAG